MKKLVDQLSVGRSATYDRVKRALLGGYLANEATKEERAWKLVLGSPLPNDFAESCRNRTTSGCRPIALRTTETPCPCGFGDIVRSSRSSGYVPVDRR